jgi:hypothetical protein
MQYKVLKGWRHVSTIQTLASEDRQAMHMSQLKEKAQVQNKLHVP